MSRAPLQGIDIVLAIAEHGSLKAAADALGIKPPAVSQQLKAFERTVGTSLFARTTRSVHLTDAGRAMVQRARPAMAELHAALDDARGAAEAHTGTLRISMPWVAWRLVMADALAALRRDHPGVAVELSLDEAFVDIVARGFHAGIRMGDRIHPDMIALRLTPPLDEICFAAPDYLRRRGSPHRLQDLPAHDCIRYRFQGSGRLQEWRFDAPGGPVEVAVGGGLVVDSFTAVVQAARDGMGIGKFFRADVDDDLTEGRLVAVLPKQVFRYPGFHLYYPRHNARLPLLRALIAALKAQPA